MCGIAGFCNLPDHWEEDIRNMNAAMYHRGPDSGAYTATEDGRVVLGHRRLAIMDLSPAGAQPMTSHSGRYSIVYNGEIYNHRELKLKLEEEGRVSAGEWRGSSDTEYLLEAFEAYGVEETIRFCKGMFAIALYDSKEKTLQLIRDRIGEKPLYYGFVNGGFVFASDLACMEAMRDFHNPIFRDVLDIYFEHGYIPAPYTIYEDLYKLQPGCILTIGVPYEKFNIKAYWSIDEVAVGGQKNPFKGSFEEASMELERLLKESLKGQMVADVPLGAFLSAGIDSSTTVALMQSLSGSRKVKSFTIGMEEKAFNEAVAAKEIAEHLGTEHTELYISEKDCKEVIPLLGRMFREPFADSSQIPTYLVSKMTREHVTVSLSGDGGDELFAGYNSYNSICRVWNKARKIPYFIRKPGGEVLERLVPRGRLYKSGRYVAADSPEELYKRMARQTADIGRIAHHERGHRPLDYIYTELPRGLVEETNHRIMLMDMHMYHPDDILVKVDRTAMAVSLETRVPMLDRDVVEFAWTLPIEYLKKGERGKLILRDVLYRYVPQELMERPKKGFSIPIMHWLKEPELRAWAEELIDPVRLKAEGYLNPVVVSRMWKRFIDKGEWYPAIWHILMFQVWLENKNKKDILL